MVEFQNTVEFDSALMVRVGAGDRRTFDKLFAAYRDRVLRFAIHMLRDVHVAEEVTNDVMLEVWKCAARYESRSRLSSWILGIARHRCLNAMRGKRVKTVAMDAVREQGGGDDPSLSARQRSDTGRALRRAVATLSAEHREVIELTFFAELSYRDVAAIAGCPENTVKTRAYHAKRLLRSALDG